MSIDSIDLLVAASAKGDADAIRRLSQSVGDGRARIDRLFGELETATKEHDERAAGFDEQLAELDAPA